MKTNRSLFLALLLIACTDNSDLSDPEASTAPTGAPTTTRVADTPADGSVPASPDEEPITEPSEGEEVQTNPVHIEGLARTFENNVSIRIVGTDGREIESTFTTARGEMGSFNPYSLDFWLTRDPGRDFSIQAVEYSAKDGKPRLLDSVAVKNDIEAIEVKLFFPRSDGTDCLRVEAVTRRIPKSVAMARLLIEALMRGPTQDEMTGGVTNPMPKGATLGSVTMDGSTAVVDFSAGMSNVGGSCRAQAIRASIETTLRALPTVTRVRILAAGDEATALQP